MPKHPKREEGWMPETLVIPVPTEEERRAMQVVRAYWQRVLGATPDPYSDEGAYSLTPATHRSTQS